MCFDPNTGPWYKVINKAPATVTIVPASFAWHLNFFRFSFSILFIAPEIYWNHLPIFMRTKRILIMRWWFWLICFCIPEYDSHYKCHGREHVAHCTWESWWCIFQPRIIEVLINHRAIYHTHESSLSELLYKARESDTMNLMYEHGTWSSWKCLSYG